MPNATTNRPSRLLINLQQKQYKYFLLPPTQQHVNVLGRLLSKFSDNSLPEKYIKFERKLSPERHTLFSKFGTEQSVTNGKLSSQV